MDEVNPGHDAAPAAPARAGDVLRAAREAQGLSLADVGARTRIPNRHLAAIEASDYQSLPSATYAMGFAKAYARAVGADEVAIAHSVRAEVDRIGRRQSDYVPHDIADPARVPPRGLAILGVGVALAILVLVALWFGTELFHNRTATTPEAPEIAAPTPAAAPRTVTQPVPAVTSGQVTLVANDEVWLRVYDANNETLFLRTMKAGERFDVPTTAREPKINVGRPDKLTIMLNGKATPPLGDGSRPIKDVRVDAAAVGARLAGTPIPAAAPAPAAEPAPPRPLNAAAIPE